MMSSADSEIESFPTIVTDRELGSDLADFHLDTGYLHEYLSTKGLSDRQIEDLTIYFSAKNSVIDGNIAERRIRYRKGRYESDGRSLCVFVDTMATASMWLDLYRDKKQFNAMFGKQVAEVLGHELEHYVADVERDFAQPEEYPMVKMENGEWTQAAYDRYLAHPEEQRARQAQGEYSPQAVMFDFEK